MDLVVNSMPLNKIDEISIIGGVKSTGMRGAAKRTEFHFGMKTIHKRVKEKFR